MVIVYKQTPRPEINPHIYSPFIFDKRAKSTQWEKKSLFNKWCWKIRYPHAKE